MVALWCVCVCVVCTYGTCANLCPSTSCSHRRLFSSASWTFSRAFAFYRTAAVYTMTSLTAPTPAAALWQHESQLAVVCATHSEGQLVLFIVGKSPLQLLDFFTGLTHRAYTQTNAQWERKSKSASNLSFTVSPVALTYIRILAHNVRQGSGVVTQHLTTREGGDLHAARAPAASYSPLVSQQALSPISLLFSSSPQFVPT